MAVVVLMDIVKDVMDVGVVMAACIIVVEKVLAVGTTKVNTMAITAVVPGTSVGICR